MECSYYKTEVSPQAEFCPKCGRAIQKAVKKQAVKKKKLGKEDL